MTKGELFELLADYHEMDEVCVCSPGGKRRLLTGINYELTSKTGRIILTTAYCKHPDGREEYIILANREYKRKKKTKAQAHKYYKKYHPKKRGRKPKPPKEPEPLLNLTRPHGNSKEARALKNAAQD